MKGDITIKILEVLKEVAISTSDLTAAFLTAGYGASSAKILGAFERRDIERTKRKQKNDEEKRLEHKYQNMIYKLKKDGLIKEVIKSHKEKLLPTKKGKEKLYSLKKKQQQFIFPNNHYAKESGGRLIIIIFDIPESKRKHRNWLRTALKSLGFTLVQRSVWIGKIKIPKQFIDDLKELELVKFVEIFEVGNSGSLQNVV